MTPAFVLDCSATLPWIFQDEATDATDRLLDDLTAGAEAWVPALWHLELGNVLIGAQRRGRIDQAGIEGFFSRLGAYEISVDTETIPRAWNKTLDLALLHQLSTYDAAYLELALRRDLPLASLDTALIRAAKATGVTLCLP
ncbi:twitching motility protein PilT [Opitutaceae bacterium TAV5]|nr:twitching motility protein PilT [Opitutaceae bacterium TAV5]